MNMKHAYFWTLFWVVGFGILTLGVSGFKTLCASTPYEELPNDRAALQRNFFEDGESELEWKKRLALHHGFESFWAIAALLDPQSAAKGEQKAPCLFDLKNHQKTHQAAYRADAPRDSEIVQTLYFSQQQHLFLALMAGNLEKRQHPLWLEELDSLTSYANQGWRKFSPENEQKLLEQDMDRLCAGKSLSEEYPFERMSKIYRGFKAPVLPHALEKTYQIQIERWNNISTLVIRKVHNRSQMSEIIFHKALPPETSDKPREIIFGDHEGFTLRGRIYPDKTLRIQEIYAGCSLYCNLPEIIFDPTSDQEGEDKGEESEETSFGLLYVGGDMMFRTKILDLSKAQGRVMGAVDVRATQKVVLGEGQEESFTRDERISFYDFHGDTTYSAPNGSFLDVAGLCALESPLVENHFGDLRIGGNLRSNVKVYDVRGRMLVGGKMTVFGAPKIKIERPKEGFDIGEPTDKSEKNTVKKLSGTYYLDQGPQPIFEVAGGMEFKDRPGAKTEILVRDADINVPGSDTDDFKARLTDSTEAFKTKIEESVRKTVQKRKYNAAGHRQAVINWYKYVNLMLLRGRRATVDKPAKAQFTFAAFDKSTSLSYYQSSSSPFVEDITATITSTSCRESGWSSGSFQRPYPSVTRTVSTPSMSNFVAQSTPVTYRSVAVRVQAQAHEMQANLAHRDFLQQKVNERKKEWQRWQRTRETSTGLPSTTTVSQTVKSESDKPSETKCAENKLTKAEDGDYESLMRRGGNAQTPYKGAEDAHETMHPLLRKAHLYTKLNFGTQDEQADYIKRALDFGVGVQNRMISLSEEYPRTTRFAEDSLRTGGTVLEALTYTGACLGGAALFGIDSGPLESFITAPLGCGLGVLAKCYADHKVADGIEETGKVLGQVATQHATNVEEEEAYQNLAANATIFGSALATRKGKKVSRIKTHMPIQAPKTLPGFPDARLVPSKTKVRGGGKSRERWEDKKYIYEWDSRHGTVEKYNKRGKHLGEFDPVSGAELKPADPKRKTNT